MVFLIGGSSHVGKTLLAQKLMEKIAVPYYSLDHLKMGLIRAGFTELTTEQDALMREYMWPVVREMIKTAIENGQDLIIEGCYIPGDWAKSFSDKYLESIKAVFIVMSESYINAHKDEIVKYGDIIEQRLFPEVDYERLISCSAMFESWATENGSACLKIETDYCPEELLDKMCAILGI